MGHRWPTATIESIATKVAMGPFGSDIKTDNFVSSGVPVIRGNNLTSGRFHAEGFVFLTEDKADDLANANAYPGDIVFTHRGTLGQVGIVPEQPFGRYVVSQSQMKLACDSTKADPLFIYYFFKSPAGQHALLMNTSQTGVPAISRPVTSLKGISLSLPPISEQRAIANILGTLDDKIELNRQTNETLETMARALFKSWFVDFDPVRTKAEGRQPSGMDAETAKLFPSELVESELGEIPKGWAVAKLGEVLELKRGYDLPTAQRLPGIVPIVSSSGPSGIHSEHKVVGPGIVTGRYGTIGQVFLVRENFWPLNTTLYVRDFKGTQLLFAYHLLCGLDFQKFSDKAAVPGINRNHVHEEPVVHPPAELQARFGEVAGAWGDLAARLDAQVRTLMSLRDAILPRLLSGEIEIQHVESMVEATA